MHAKSLSAFCRNLDLDEPAIYHISNKEVKITLPLMQLQKLYPVLLEYNKEAKTPLFNSVFFYDLLALRCRETLVRIVSLANFEHSTA